MVTLQHDKIGHTGCLDGHSVRLVWKLMLCDGIPQGKWDIVGFGGIYPVDVHSDVHRYLSKTCPSVTIFGMEKNDKTEATLKLLGLGRLKSQNMRLEGITRII